VVRGSPLYVKVATRPPTVSEKSDDARRVNDLRVVSLGAGEAARAGERVAEPPFKLRARDVQTQLPLVGISVPFVAFIIAAPVLVAALQLSLTRVGDVLPESVERPSLKKQANSPSFPAAAGSRMFEGVDFRSWPGKSDDEGGVHPAAWHMLDVAAAAERLIADHQALKALSAERRVALVALVALHDLGKFSAVFRAQIERGAQPPQDFRHWRLSERLLEALDADIGAWMDGSLMARKALYASVAGHHGGPQRGMNRHERFRQLRAIGPDATMAARAFVAELRSLFSEASLAGVRLEEAKRLSWLLSGLTVAADWIGSNTEWFGLASPDIPFATYWERARESAATAVAEAGLMRARPALALAPPDLVGFADLRPMQRVAAEATLPDGPCLALVEDATGAGKTEAALILAQRMMAAGKGRGLYFALPTTATADAMFDRMRPVLGRLFQGRPSLALAHGRRLLSDAFAEVRGAAGDSPEDAACAAWLADDRRRSLLAEIGVGTIDQALMAVLPTRFSTLRLWALSNRVLIVDEAHAYDPYMETQLRALLRFHAMLGGSAIVMTATLPRRMRDGYVSAFRAGLGASDAPLGERNGYPALSVMAASAAETFEPAPAPAMVRRVEVERLPDASAAVSAVVEAARAGAACVWVRNAVDDAIAAAATLRDHAVETEILHARFAMGDRLEIERRVVARFGKTGEGRAGRVLVATQVVEASLDLDFDMMVSDLAPIGALIQRGGRLWRHMDARPAERRPVPGPRLRVVSPDPSAATSDRWLHEVLDRGAYVYPQDAQWRTADALFRAGAINAPDGLRALIEAVHGDEPAQLPDPLAGTELDTQGRALSEAGQALVNVANAGDAYAQERMAHVFDDRKYPTRLGEEQVTLVLARREGGKLRPWIDDRDRMRAEALSEIQLSRRLWERLPDRPGQDDAEIRAFKKGWPDWRKEHDIVAVVGEDGAIVDGLRYDAGSGLMTAP
jgi:CRISPR-associated endonuclease/helicase Cas3